MSEAAQPFTHSRQPATLQSVVVLQAAPASFCAEHTPLLSQ
jgi:hypothetical protein